MAFTTQDTIPSLFDNSYPLSSFGTYLGADDTSLLGGNVRYSDGLFAVSSYGYNLFEGQILIVKPVATYTYSVVATVSAPSPDAQFFGRNMAFVMPWLVATAPAFDLFNGAVHVYSVSDSDSGNVRLNATLSSRGIRGQDFGRSVSLYKDYLSIATRSFVFIYKYSDYQWAYYQNLTSPVFEELAVTGEGNRFGFGYATQMYEGFLMVASLLDGGRVHVYKLISDVWTYVETLEPPSPSPPYTIFGFTLATTTASNGRIRLAITQGGEALKYGASDHVLSEQGNTTARVLVYEMMNISTNSSGWQLVSEIVAPAQGDVSFGKAVSMSQDQILIGSPLYPLGRGSAFLYTGTYKPSDTPTVTPSASPSLTPSQTPTALPSASPSISASPSQLPSLTPSQSPSASPSEFPTSAPTQLASTNASRRLQSVAFTGEELVWEMGLTFLSPIGYQAGNYANYYGVALALSPTHLFIGNDALDAGMRGGLYMGSVIPKATGSPSSTPTPAPTTVDPTSFPTSSPTVVPTMSPTDPGQVSGGGEQLASEEVQRRARTTIVVLLVFAGLAGGGAVTLIIVCICCMRPTAIPPAAKKKKKEEEDSPFTVYGPYDYNINNPPPVPSSVVSSPSIPPHPYPHPYPPMYYYYYPYPYPAMDKKGMGKDGKDLKGGKEYA
eukprot:gene32998-39911_t